MGEAKQMSAPQGLFFEDFVVGQSLTSQGRTITEADLIAFASLSGDWNPIHTDAVYAAQQLYGQRIVHGLLGLSIASAMATHLGFLENTLLAFRQIDGWKFSLPIFINDTIHVKVTVSALKPVRRLNGGMVTLEAEIINQKDQVVQRGFWQVLVKSCEDGK